VALSPTVRRYDQLLIDLDGCVWVGDEPTDRAQEALAALREAGTAVAFLTNDVRHAPEEFVRKLWRLGFQAALDEVVTAGAAIQYLLSDRGGGAAYVVGSQALVDHVAEAGMRIVNRTEFATRADVVVVGGHEAFGFEELKIASQAVQRGAELIGATRDPTFPMPDGPWPGTGAVLARSRSPPAGARPASSESPSPRCTRPPATGSARVAAWPSATASTSTSPARGGPGWTPRSC
jgi:ribonucleotide monophosphatase NagD (HAD superfamily)